MYLGEYVGSRKAVDSGIVAQPPQVVEVESNLSKTATAVKEHGTTFAHRVGDKLSTMLQKPEETEQVVASEPEKEVVYVDRVVEKPVYVEVEKVVEKPVSANEDSTFFPDYLPDDWSEEKAEAEEAELADAR